MEEWRSTGSMLTECREVITQTIDDIGFFNSRHNGGVRPLVFTCSGIWPKLTSLQRKELAARAVCWFSLRPCTPWAMFSAAPARCDVYL